MNVVASVWKWDFSHIIEQLICSCHTYFMDQFHIVDQFWMEMEMVLYHVIYTRENRICQNFQSLQTLWNIVENMKIWKHEIGTFCYIYQKSRFWAINVTTNGMLAKRWIQTAKLCILPSSTKSIDIVRIILVHLPLITLSIPAFKRHLLHYRF